MKTTKRISRRGRNILIALPLSTAGIITGLYPVMAEHVQTTNGASILGAAMVMGAGWLVMSEK